MNIPYPRCEYCIDLNLGKLTVMGEQKRNTLKSNRIQVRRAVRFILQSRQLPTYFKWPAAVKGFCVANERDLLWIAICCEKSKNFNVCLRMLIDHNSFIMDDERIILIFSIIYTVAHFHKFTDAEISFCLGNKVFTEMNNQLSNK